MPLNPLITPRYDIAIVALSYLIASFASYVALDMAKRVRSPDRVAAAGWGLAGSVAMGTGIWAMHFVGMLSLRLPFAVGYGYAETALSWVAAVAASGVALTLAGGAHLNAARLAGGALAMGGAICVMHYTGMAALALSPGIRWDPVWVAASVVIAVAASAAALLIFFWLRGLQGLAAWRGQAGAALVMGAAIWGMHYSGMAAAGFEQGSLCLTSGRLRGDSLGALVGLAALALLTLTLFSSVLDARMQRHTARLAASLHDANSELRQAPLRDTLTGLPNRPALESRIAEACQRSALEGTSLALVFLDLDGFKPVNDSFGHELGDAVLRELAQRLAAALGPDDVLARLGSDQFAVLLGRLHLREASLASALAAQRLLEPCAAPLAAGGRDLRLSASLGIALHEAALAPAALLGRAEAAMNAAKRHGGAGYAFFEPHMHADTREQVELLQDLRDALARGELSLHYQAKVMAADGEFTGVEALLRWQHPRRGMVPPASFIPVAERFGLIATLGDWVLGEACRQISAWQEAGLRIPVAVNLSMHQLRQEDLVHRVRHALLSHGVAPALLTLEITESAAMEDAQRSMAVFQRLRELGVKLSIDDFGTGYSSLSYLRQLRAHQLKIDRSFVQDLEHGADARAIVEAVVRLAHALGMEVVAEGVETAAQREVLAGLNCNKLQGYLFARPVPAPTVSAWACGEPCPGPLRFADPSSCAA